MALSRARPQKRMELEIYGRTQLQNKDSRSACDLRDHTDIVPYMVTGANELQQQVPEILTGQIHSQPDLQRQESAHDSTLDTSLPVAELVTAEQPQDPINRLADVLVSLLKNTINDNSTNHEIPHDFRWQNREIRNV